MQTPIEDRTRRRVLKTGATLLTVSGIAVAGCADTDPGSDLGGGPDETDGEDGTVEDETVEDEIGTHEFAVETVADGMDHPWAIAFLPDEPRLLVTERGGELLLVEREPEGDAGTAGTAETVSGTPAVHAVGQGGLLDVAIDPEFPDDPWVYLTYAAANDDGESATHIGRGRLDRDGPRLEAFETLHVAEPFAHGDRGHYGSRIAFGADGTVYVTVGDRQYKEFGPDHVAQDPSNELGTTLRLARDGSIPEDNPFVDDPDVANAVFSYGHRNVQGMTVRPETGAIWQSEHGERDGDEINVVRAGGNHGWPIVHYGCEYGTDDPVGEAPHEHDDTVDPVHYWECGSGGFPPAGMTFYDGDAFPEWKGDLFVGNLAGEFLGRFVVDGDDGGNGTTDSDEDGTTNSDEDGTTNSDEVRVEEVDPLLADRGWRVRDVAVAPDSGHLYVAVDDADAPVVRLTPE